MGHCKTFLICLNTFISIKLSTQSELITNLLLFLSMGLYSIVYPPSSKYFQWWLSAFLNLGSINDKSLWSEDKSFKPRDTENNEPLITKTAFKTGSLPHQELNINLLQPSKHINPSGDREQHTFCDISSG